MQTGEFYVSDTPSDLLGVRVARAEKQKDGEGASARPLPRVDGFLAALICVAMLGVSFLCASPLFGTHSALNGAVGVLSRLIADSEVLPVTADAEEVVNEVRKSSVSYIAYESAEEYIASPPVSEAVFGGIMPASGEIISDFSYRDDPLYGRGSSSKWDFHNGIDIPLNVGSEVRAFADGTVRESGESPSYGIYLVIRHADGFESVYAHLSGVNRGVGAEVRQGEVVAYSGSTGMVTGPHLHFELHRDGVPVDPEDYIK